MLRKIIYILSFTIILFTLLFFSANNSAAAAACALPSGKTINDGETWRETNCGGQLDTGDFCDKYNQKLEYSCSAGVYTQTCVTDPDCQETPGTGTGGSSSAATDVFQYNSGLGIYANPPSCYIGNCPAELQDIYPNGEKCVNSFAEFKTNPGANHYWVEDQKVTAQGKADERARQFIYWVINKNSIDDYPVIKQIWNNTRNLSYFFTILITAIMGIGFIVGQKANFETKLKVWPLIWRVFASLLYITFSFAIVITLIQLSEILTKFFIENLGGKDVFNIYFGSKNSEANYTDFIGCRDSVV